jgi:hypothetical protein
VPEFSCDGLEREHAHRQLVRRHVLDRRGASREQVTNDVQRDTRVSVAERALLLAGQRQVDNSAAHDAGEHVVQIRSAEVVARWSHRERLLAGRGARSARLQGESRGPARIRTWDRRIMSPLL